MQLTLFGGAPAAMKLNIEGVWLDLHGHIFFNKYSNINLCTFSSPEENKTTQPMNNPANLLHVNQLLLWYELNHKLLKLWLL